MVAPFLDCHHFWSPFLTITILEGHDPRGSPFLMVTTFDGRDSRWSRFLLAAILDHHLLDSAILDGHQFLLDRCHFLL